MPRKTTKKSTIKGSKSYKHPVPGRNELLEFLENEGKPVKAEGIMAGFGLRGQRMRGLLLDRLQGMVRAGQVIENRRREYCLTAKIDLIVGRVAGHKDGFGFVIPNADR